MTTIDDLRASDTLQVSAVDYRLHLPVLGSREGSSIGFCKRKTPGDLSFTLTSEDLNLVIPGLEFNFREKDVDPVRSVVTWAVDQSLDLWYSIAHITHVRGELAMRVVPNGDTVATDCTGQLRVFRSLLTMLPGRGEIVVSTSVGTASVSDISGSVAAGEPISPVDVNVSIRSDSWHQTACGRRFLRPDVVTRFSAVVSGIETVGGSPSISFSWTVHDAGVRVVGPTDQRSISLEFEEPGVYELTLDVTVSTDVHVGTRRARLMVSVLDEQGERVARLLCTFERTTAQTFRFLFRGTGDLPAIGVIPIFDPLWDPSPIAREPVAEARALALQELRELETVFEELSRQTLSIAAAAKKAYGWRETQLIKRLGKAK